MTRLWSRWGRKRPQTPRRQSRLVFAMPALVALSACGSTVETGEKTTTTESTTATGSTTGTTSATTGTTTTPPACGSTLVSAEPGCGDPPPGVTPLPGVGCYEKCTTVGTPCVTGGKCTKTWTNPCPCPDPNQPCCGACAGEELRCLP